MNKKMALASAPIRIVVIDESELFRAGIGLLLDGHPGFQVVGMAGDQEDALSLVKLEQPDVALVSISQNDGRNLALLPEILAVGESTRVLVISGSSDLDVNRRAIHLGATGLVSRDNPPEILIKAVEKVYAGEAWLDRSTTASILRDLSPRKGMQKRDPDEVKIGRLTNREREIVKMVGKGLKNKQIASRLCISDVTVHHHLTSIYSKLEVGDRLELLIYAYCNGLAELPH